MSNRASISLYKIVWSTSDRKVNVHWTTRKDQAESYVKSMGLEGVAQVTSVSIPATKATLCGWLNRNYTTEPF